MYGRTKYGAKKTEIDGIKFDSQIEAKRYVVLKRMEDEGEISNLRLQVPYELLPSKKGKYRTERAIKYLADFVYEKDGEEIVEDVKGMRLSDYVLKRKMMLHFHDVSIYEYPEKKRKKK